MEEFLEYIPEYDAYFAPGTLAAMAEAKRRRECAEKGVEYVVEDDDEDDAECDGSYPNSADEIGSLGAGEVRPAPGKPLAVGKPAVVQRELFADCVDDDPPSK
jgi:hypothetical protein